MNKSVIVENIIKTYPSGKKDKIIALDQISFSVDKGELFGLIGPDGAGKSSLFRILVTLLLADSGSVRIEGIDVVKDYMKIREISGYMPGKFSLYQDLSVEENLSFFATIFNTTVKQNYDLIKDIYIQLEPFKDRKAGALSGGMKQKLALCCALIHRPTILFLDEPTTGVDAVSRVEFWDMLKTLKAEGITILVSTAYMDEASRCDHIALINNGKILGQDTPEGISKSFGENLWAIKHTDMYGLLKQLRSMAEIHAAYPSGEFHHVTLHQQEKADNLLGALESKGFHNAEFKRIEPNVEDVFLKKMR